MSNLQRAPENAGAPTPDQLAAIQSLKEQTEEIRALSTPEPVVVDTPDLDAELAELASMVDDQVAVEEAAPLPLQEEIQRDVLQLLAGQEDAPSEDQIELWKEKHGPESIQLLGLDKDNVYIYTHLTLPQWEKINEIVAKAQGTPMADKIQGMIREKVIRTAVLWPKLDPRFFQTCRAGLPDTLYQLILIHSYFLSPQQAMTLTTQL